ncbi:MAG: AMIN domain-containing protein, partial [Methylophilus sp.]
MNQINIIKPLIIAFGLVVMMLSGSLVYAVDKATSLGNSIESVDFVSLSGGRVNIKVMLKSALATSPASFALNSPARIALDFPNTANGLNKSTIDVGQGALKSVLLAQAKDRTRMVLN